MLKLKQIKHNEYMGLKIEEIVAADFPECERPFFRGPYDIETKDTLIEVKSCRTKTKNKKYTLKNGNFIQYYCRGRFLIILKSHTQLRDMAIAFGKKAKYLFVVYVGDRSIKILDKCLLTWEAVQELFAKCKGAYTRKDGTSIVTVPMTKIFKQTKECVEHEK
jgi:hypothetical protein